MPSSSFPLPDYQNHPKPPCTIFSNTEKRMIRIEIAHTKNGGSVWSHNSTSAKSLTDLARAILPTVGDEPWEAGRDGKTDMTGKSLANIAKYAATEGDKQRPRVVKWMPHPMAGKRDEVAA